MAYCETIIYSSNVKFHFALVVALSISMAPGAIATIKPVKPAAIDYSDVTGPKFEKVKIDKNTLNLSKKAVVVKILVTVSDDLNSVNDVGVYFSRLDAEGKITGPKLMDSKPKPSIRIKSIIVAGRRIEVFEMASTFPKGLAAGSYKLMVSDFRDLAQNRRQDLSTANNSAEFLPIITVK